MMEMPWRCKTCNYENLVDMQSLTIWPVDRVIGAKGFQCEQCGMMEVVGYTTISLLEQKRKLVCYPPEHPKFNFLFKKCLRKAEGINERGEAVYGEIRHQDLAAP